MTKFEKMIQDLASASETIEGQSGYIEEVDAIDNAISILQQINQWCDAYPENIFIPMTSEDWKEHHDYLKTANRSGSAAAADSMRHVCNGIKKVLNQ